MNCKEIENKLGEFQDANIHEKDREEILNHLQECATCAAIDKGMRNSLQIIDHAQRKVADPYFFNRLQAQLHEEQSTKLPQLPYALRYAFAASIACVGIVIGGIIGSYSAEQLNNQFVNSNQLEQTDDLSFDIADNSFDLINDFQ